jgi:hypothetical protein
MTAMAFTLVIALLTVMLAFVNGIYDLQVQLDMTVYLFELPS